MTKNKKNLSGFTDEELTIFKGMLFNVTHENDDCCTKPFYQMYQEEYDECIMKDIRDEIKTQKADEALEELASFAY